MLKFFLETEQSWNMVPETLNRSQFSLKDVYVIFKRMLKSATGFIKFLSSEHP
jgi:hypothetical protein